MDITAETALNGDDLSGLSVAVYGLGKMGLPLAGVLADNGAEVTGVDIDAETVTAVNEGRTPIDEPGLSDLLQQYSGDRLTATSDGPRAAREATVMIVLVPTLITEAFEPDIDAVLAAGEAIADGVSSGDLVILESTVPPGTTADPFAETVEPDDLTAGVDFGVVHSPERTSAGRVITDLTESYPKIVGGTTLEGTAAAATLYRTFNEPGVIEMPSATAAEAVKVFEGVYRDVNIGLANELAKVCEEWGVNADVVFDAANSQPYCDIHDPGIGVGGHCSPVYPYFIINPASDTPLLETAREVNDDMPHHTVDIIDSLVSGQGLSLASASVLVLGLTYRPGVRETRFAPAFDAIGELQRRGASVAVHDPILSEEEIAQRGAEPVEDVTSAAWDALVLATGHEQYRDIDLDALRNRMRTPILVDGRNFFEPEDVDGFIYARIGDGTRQHGG